jgi:hypothetical protein
MISAVLVHLPSCCGIVPAFGSALFCVLTLRSAYDTFNNTHKQEYDMTRNELHELMEFIDGVTIGGLVGWTAWSVVVHLVAHFA